GQAVWTIPELHAPTWHRYLVARPTQRIPAAIPHSALDELATLESIDEVTYEVYDTSLVELTGEHQRRRRGEYVRNVPNRLQKQAMHHLGGDAVRRHDV